MYFFVANHEVFKRIEMAFVKTTVLHNIEHFLMCTLFYALSTVSTKKTKKKKIKPL